MYTATVHQQDGDGGNTKHLTTASYERAKTLAAELLPKHDGSSVVLERHGVPVGKWKSLNGGRAVWTTEE